jgi:chromosome partitioning protein
VIRLTISNQRGGVGKTTSAVTLARCFADRGMRVLMIDADPQGSIAVILGLKPPAFLNDLLIEMGLPGSEFLFRHVLSDCEKDYDVVLIDVAPSISLFQTCAMVYTQNVLVPVDMDILSVQGATSTIHACEALNRMLDRGLNICLTGMLPVKLNRRLAVTEIVLDTLASISEKRNVPIYGAIRTDQSVVRSAAERRFLTDCHPRSKALEDYEQLTDALITQFAKTEAVAVDGKTA